jgi:hypothetical protein
MTTLRLPYGGGPVEVADADAEMFIGLGYVRVSNEPSRVTDSTDLVPPPQGGPGSGVKAWQKYALDLGLAWAEDSEVTRDEFIERIEEAGFPV